MAEKKYNILKAASWYTIGNILIKGVSFFVLPIFTGLMSPADYGVYSIYISYLSIFEVMMLFGMSSTVNIAKYDKKLDFEKYISSIILIPIILTVVSAFAANVYFLFGTSLLSMERRLWNFLFLSASAAAISNIICARLVIEGKYAIYMFYSLLSVLSNVGLSLLLCYFIYKNDDVYMARVWGTLISSILAMFFLVRATKLKINFNLNYLKIGLCWGGPLLFHTLATVVLTQSDRIIIKFIEGYSNAGIYSIAVTIIAIPMVLQSSFASAWAPWFYEKLDKKEYKTIQKLNDKYIILFATIITEFMLICPEIIHLFTKQAYWNSVYCLIPLSISIFGEMLYSLPVTIEYYNRKTNYIMFGTIMATTINIGLDFLFVYICGYIGAAYATTISKIILFGFHWVLSKKIDASDIFHMSTVVGCLATLLCINIFTVMTVKYIFARVIVFVVIGAIFVWRIMRNKQLLMEFVK